MWSLSRLIYIVMNVRGLQLISKENCKATWTTHAVIGSWETSVFLGTNVPVSIVWFDFISRAICFPVRFVEWYTDNYLTNGDNFVLSNTDLNENNGTHAWQRLSFQLVKYGRDNLSWHKVMKEKTAENFKRTRIYYHFLKSTIENYKHASRCVLFSRKDLESKWVFI